MADDLDIPEFGYLPFDLYIMAVWDPVSSVSKEAQKRLLVDKWIRMGRYGRNKYMTDIPDADEIPPHVPQDLLSGPERAVDGQISRTLFIRTWFGGVDADSQRAADEAYARLRVAVMQQGDPDEENDCLDESFIFEQRRELAEVTGQGEDVVDGVAVGTPGRMPEYLLRALCHCPDQLDGVSDRPWRHDTAQQAAEKEEEVNRQQNLLVAVADRTACETGWVLQLAVNHKGEVLPFRVREQASMVETAIANWMDGQGLAENTSDPEEATVLYMREGDGWD